MNYLVLLDIIFDVDLNSVNKNVGESLIFLIYQKIELELFTLFIVFDAFFK